VLPSRKSDGTPVLELRRLVCGYNSRTQRSHVAGPIDETLRAGELACLIGPNGAGKSTLMRTLAGLQAPLEGTVLFNGDDVHRMAPAVRARHLAIVLTEVVQVPLLTGYDLVAFGRVPFTGWSGKLTAHDRRVIAQSLEAVGAVEFASRQVAELSDGERQRVMIARALAQEPSAMILDEITGFLDLPRRVEIMQLLRRTAHDAGCAVLLSTHDLDLALSTADRIWLMAKQQPLRAAIPEALVLEGAFQAAFSLDDVAFDERTGAFRVRHARRSTVVVTGEPPAAMWTARALERYGFHAVEDAQTADVRVNVIRGTVGTSWELHADGVARHHDSLEAVLAAVRNRHDQPRRGARQS
jgi:iron complex transport system ATP-binding protein